MGWGQGVQYRTPFSPGSLSPTFCPFPSPPQKRRIKRTKRKEPPWYNKGFRYHMGKWDALAPLSHRHSASKCALSGQGVVL